MKNYYVIETKQGVLWGANTGSEHGKLPNHSSLEELEDGGLTSGGCCGFGGRIANSRFIMVISDDALIHVMPGDRLSAKVVDPDLILVVEQYHYDQPQSSASKWSCLPSFFKSQSRDFDSSQPCTVVAFSSRKVNENVATGNKRLKAMKQYCTQLNSTSQSSAVNDETPLLP